MRESIDPVTVEIVRNALTAIAERCTRRMIRSAISFIIKEMEDCSAALFDCDGRLLAESSTIPIHLNCTGVCLSSILARFIPASDWAPGDVVVTNDPYCGEESLASAHTNDYIVFCPVFVAGTLAGFAGLMVHHLDIGASRPGTRGWNTDIFQEGLRLPPVRIARNGVIEAPVLDIILNNTRLPEMMENDVRAQISSIGAAGVEMAQLFQRYGATDMAGCIEALIDQSERRTRQEIRKIPDGIYRHEEPILDDGAKGGPYWLRLRLEKTDDEIVFDFTGTDPQVAGPINAPLATTWAAIFYTMRCITDPTIPSTEGCKRPLRVIAPAGTLVNARKPAAVYQRMIVCHSLVDLIMGALSQAVPERVMADSSGCSYNFIAVPDPDGGRPRLFGEVAPGGLGATMRGSGIEVMACHVTNSPIPPIEATEAESPVLYLRREMRIDSGGPGQMRGGVGQVLSYKLLAPGALLQYTSQKSRSLPQGMQGGHPGDGGRWVINEGLANERVLPKTVGDLEELALGDTVTQYTPGGGGFGSPQTRESALIEADLQAGYISRHAAETIYGYRAGRTAR